MLWIYVTEFLTFLEAILDDQACLHFEDCISYLLSSLGFASSWQLSCSLRILSQATSIPGPPSSVSHRTSKLIPLLQAHTEQHQVNSLWIFLPKTWILNLIPPGDLTTITQ
ncbi:hypothetical protein ATANTOWER_011211 [Ataeniobius toweri]|uniref:Uncharacterized protein n=1 Tax=Ataeniobius toweri TaxID=208326 RepID=A0ABU7B8P6_9TELE|nr:hypothetical protein [Ataeniobius toweri]